ncbi:tetratricopeptide repeat protein 1-like [Mangifera indica]|uniref:tetratricopeptide repeat protein 1-like n=1 Tax=Mangifera indica TaxID=29780 RepID=UPI001CF949C4|nr:tetratricopeptide repeat protein 1-like [Mangifera indica]
MVLIEQEPRPSSVSTTKDRGTAATADASDGFETASERDVGDNETNDAQGRLKDQALKQRKAVTEANETKLEGNKLFGEAKYEEALLQYEFALNAAESAPVPEELNELRSICHSNRAVCFLKLEKYENTIKECTKALELNPTYMKALARRAETHEKLEHFEEAITDLKKILELDPANNQARKTIIRLEPLAAEKREKMKEEMIGKLKEMGNSILGRFGMSTDNFKAVQDPKTGSYSIQFQR